MGQFNEIMWALGQNNPGQRQGAVDTWNPSCRHELHMGPLTTYGPDSHTQLALCWAVFQEEMAAFDGTSFNETFLKDFKKRLMGGNGRWNVKEAVRVLATSTAGPIKGNKARKIEFEQLMQNIKKQCNIMRYKQQSGHVGYRLYYNEANHGQCAMEDQIKERLIYRAALHWPNTYANKLKLISVGKNKQPPAIDKHFLQNQKAKATQWTKAQKQADQRWERQQRATLRGGGTSNCTRPPAKQMSPQSKEDATLAAHLQAELDKKTNNDGFLKMRRAREKTARRNIVLQ